MAGEAITFDFIGRGAGQLADSFRKTGDTAALAARGARLCADGIEKQRKAADASIGATLALAKADKLLEEAEHGLAAGALEAEFALRGQGDAAKKAGRQAADARGGFASLAGEVTGFGAAADAAGSGGSKLQLAMAGLNLASGVAEPALAGVVVAAGGLAAGFAAAGAGLAVFGVVAKTVFSEAQQAATKYAAAQQKYASATTSKQRAAALQAEKAAFAGLSPPVRTLAVELGNTQKKWKAFTDAAAPGVVGVISKGLGLLPKIFAAMKPFLAPVETALSGIIAKLNTGLSSTGFTSFIGALARNTGPAITKIAAAIGNVIVGIGGILKAFLPTSQQMLTGIDKITAKFREWGTTLSSHSGFQSLMATFKSETPQAVAILKNLGAVLVNVGKAIFGLSTFSNSKLLLQALLPLSGVMASLSKNTVLVRVALYSLAAVKIGQQFSWVTDAWKGIVKFAAATEGATVAQTIAAAATRAWALAMDALPWVALAAAVVVTAALVIKYHQQIWAFAQRVWHDVLAVIMGVWGWIGKNWPLLVGIMTGPIGLAVVMIIKHWQGMTTGIAALFDIAKENIRIIWDKIKILFLGGVDAIMRTMGKLPGPLGAPFRAAHKSIAVELAGIQRDVGSATRNIQADWDRIHGKTVRVNFVGSGSGSIAFKQSIPGVTTGPSSQGILGFHAAGGVIRGGTPGRDSVLGMLMPGEVVVPTGMVAAGEVDHLRGRLPGFAAGGMITGMGASDRIPAAGEPFMAKAEAAFGRAVEGAFAKAAIAKFKADMNSLGGSGQSIANYAMSFLGRLPYVWGGTSLTAGADCSGFVQAIYKHFGIHAPRTSEAQGAWVRRSGPQPGGLAFYHSPAGGADPGHVGIVRSAGQVISQGGGMGPTLIPLHALPLLWTGVPPGGFPGGAGGGGGPSGGQMSGGQVAALWTADGGPAGAAANMARIAFAESGDRPGAVQTGQPPGLTGYGLYQITPTSGIRQNGAFGNLLNASNNTRAAISLFSQSGYRPWASDPVGRQLAAAPFGFASGGLVGAQGAAYLKAWRSRRGGGFGAAWGPVVVNQQIAEVNAAAQRARTLAGAGGLSARQHKRWASAAAYETRRLGVLRKELGVERAWRGQLGAGEVTLGREIRAAGNLPSLAGNVRGWKAQLGRDKATVGNISKMLGYSDAHLKAHPPAPHPGKHPPPGPKLPPVTHTYGGDVANNLGAVLSAALGPFTGAARGGMVMDSGGWLKPGWNPPSFNGTGRPEHLVPVRSGGAQKLQIEWVGGNGGSDLERWIRKNVKIRGGGDVQRAYGSR